MASYRDMAVGKCCLNCEDRFPACHDVCSTFLKAKAEWQEVQEKINEEKYKHKEWNSYHYGAVSKQYREKKNHKGR